MPYALAQRYNAEAAAAEFLEDLERFPVALLVRQNAVLILVNRFGGPLRVAVDWIPQGRLIFWGCLRRFFNVLTSIYIHVWLQPIPVWHVLLHPDVGVRCRIKVDELHENASMC